MGEYTINEGNEGAKRLDVLSRTLEKSTHDFLSTVGINERSQCLDLGCGTGKVSAMMAKMLGEQGHVLGRDLNALNVHVATDFTKAKGLKNVRFETFDVYELNEEHTYDIIYTRFLLSHLTDPSSVLKNILNALKPGGKLLIEETDFSGHFSYPKSEHFDQYVSLYQALLEKRGANANLGLHLPQLLTDAGFTKVSLQLSQPVHMDGEGKLMAEITFKGISESLIEEGLISQDAFDEVQAGLIEFRKRTDTLISMPRIFQIVAKVP